MTLQTIVITFTILALFSLLFLNKKWFSIHGWYPLVYFAVYKTSIGLKAMNWAARTFPRILNILGTTGIVVGIAGMIIITTEIVLSTIKTFAAKTAPSVMLVLPIKAKGILYVPPLYLLACIIVIAIVHEYGHGVLARREGIPVKSSGFGFLGILIPIIPAAFVEPDEKEVAKARTKQQLSVYAAGPFFNILTALLLLFLLGFELPGLIPHSVTGATAVYDLGGTIAQLSELEALEITTQPNSPAALALQSGMLLTAVNNISITNKSFIETLSKILPGTPITMTFQNDTKTITPAPHPLNASKGWIGVQFAPKIRYTIQAVQMYGERGAEFLTIIGTFITWLIILSLGIALFNLLPLGPLDGGRMLKEILERYLPSKANSIFASITALLFLSLITQVLFGLLPL